MMKTGWMSGRLQDHIMELRAQMPRLAPCWVAGAQYAVAALGLGSGKPVSPLQPLTPEEQQKVEAFVRAGADA
jgi:dihydrodipicolinate synthase/N-acetylneuraminate lyase